MIIQKQKERESLNKITVTNTYLENLLDCLKNIRTNAGITYSERDELNKIIKNTRRYLDKIN